MSRRVSYGGGVSAGQVARARTYWWEWDNATARRAQSVSADDVGSIGYQQDIALAYQLVGVSPSRWAPLADPAMGPPRETVVVPQSTTPTNVGLAMVVISGTATGRSQSTTNRSTQVARMQVLTAAGAGSSAVYRSQTSVLAYASSGGIRRRFVGVPGTVSASMRWYMGVMLGTFTGNVDPDTATHAVGIGCSGAADVNLQLYHNDGTGTCTKVDLGAAFPAATADTGYQLDLYTFDGSSWGYNVRNLNTDDEVSGDLSADIPAPNNVLLDMYYSSNNVDASAVSLDFSSLQVWQRLV